MRKRTVLITGSGNGIGRATALELARRGYAVGGVDRDDAGAAETAKMIRENGGAGFAQQGDVADPDSLRDAVDTAVGEWGYLSCAVACAGVEVVGSVLDLEAEQWARSLTVNATGVFNLAKAAMPQLISERGAFVAIASDAGTQGAQGYAAYAAAKHAVVGLVKSMALDHGHQGVRSNVVCPAFVETAMADRIFAETDPGEADFYRNAVPLGRFAKSDEVASAVAHLLGDEASYANGLIYALDGGITAGAYRKT